MTSPTDQELSEKEKDSGLEEQYSELSDVQFSAQITAEITTDTENAAEVDDIIGAAEREQEEMTRRDREILAALDEVLKSTRQQPVTVQKEKKHRKSFKRIAVGVIGKGAGLVSMALTLIMMGTALICLFFSAEQDFSLLMKLAPAAAVFLGIEILLSWFASGRKIRINIPCTIIIAAVTAGCCVLSVTLNKSIVQTEQEFSDRMAEANIYDASYKKLRHTADISTLTVNVDLNLESGRKRTSEELYSSDKIEIEAVLDGSYSSPSDFAAECAGIIDVFRELDIPVDKFRFSCETRLMSFALNVEGRYQQDYTAEELTKLVRYVFIEDYDYIHDLADLTEESAESTTEN